jgi:GGDEF domain-containing protein
MPAFTTNRDTRTTTAAAASTTPAHTTEWRVSWADSLLLLVPGLAALHLVAPSGKTLLELALAATLLVLVTVRAARRGMWMRRGARVPYLKIAERRDVMAAGDVLLQQAIADRRPLSVAVLELHDLPEVRRLFGRQLASQVLARTARSLRAVAGPKGLVMRTSPTQFTLVVPGVDDEAVLLSLRTVFGEACCIEEDSDADEVVLLPHFHVATVQPGCGSVEPVYAILCERLLPSLHGAHPRWRGGPAAEVSQPVSLGPQSLGSDVAPAVYVPTLPLPLR